MKQYIKIALILIFLIICVVFGVKYGMQVHYNNEVAEINASRNTALDNYNSNKKLAESYLQVYKIVDESSYQMIKNDMYHSFSTEMQKELFPTVNYEGIDLHRMDTKLIRIMCTNNGPREKNTFLVEYNLKAVNYDQDITNLIDIENGVITRVTRIK